MREPAAHPAAPVDARLVVDSRSSAAQLGVRGPATAERRLLFQAPGAHVELRVQPSRDAAKPAWLHGMFVATGVAARGGRVKVRLSAEGGVAVEVEATETGEFALPCDPAKPFALHFEPPGGVPVRVRIEG